ncbi:MAG: UxaA family hydrolase [Planctomycetota bacterium]
MSAPPLRIHPDDDVAVALTPLAAGEQVLVGEAEITLHEAIPAAHKLSLRHIAAGEAVRKYGEHIGKASADIPPGAWVHTHNLATGLAQAAAYSFSGDTPVPPTQDTGQTFLGFQRTDGDVGIRNEVWVIPTVGCVNTTAQRLCAAARERFADRAIDGIHTFSHPYGCSQLGDDHRLTQRFLAGLVRHPNAGAVLVLGLGCENNNLAEFREALGPVDPQRVAFLDAQDPDDEIAAGLAALAPLVDHAADAIRSPCPLGALRVGLKCGGSDAFSGITANTVVGVLSDRLCAAGGTSVLTEVPEMFGAEHLLMARARDRQVYDATVALVEEFKHYFTRHGQPVYENPSPGNKEGGISTLEEKSLGCTQKGGTGPVIDVLAIGQRPERTGLHLLDGPGNDMVAITGLAAAGCHLVLFTTGRGTPLGGPVPTLKISSNSELAAHKPHWIDFDAGRLLAGDTDLPRLGDELLDLLLTTAGGRPARNESNGYREIAIFKDGVTL